MRFHAVLVLASFVGFSAPEIGLEANEIIVGRDKAETCLGCHAVEGYFNVYPTYRVPKLGGQSPGYILSALRAYKVGSRKHETMHANAENLSDQDMKDIAEYLSNYTE